MNTELRAKKIGLLVSVLICILMIWPHVSFAQEEGDECVRDLYQFCQNRTKIKIASCIDFQLQFTGADCKTCYGDTIEICGGESFRPYVCDFETDQLINTGQRCNAGKEIEIVDQELYDIYLENYAPESGYDPVKIVFIIVLVGLIIYVMFFDK